MESTILKDLSIEDMQAVVNGFTYKVKYPQLFPLQFNTTLDWKMLEGGEGVPVAADVIAYDASNPLKKREAIGKATGSIPKIAIEMHMKESELNLYQELLYHAGQGNSSAARRLIDLKFGDMGKCFNGVNMRLEWLAMQAASTGKFTLTRDTNNAVVTEYDVDFGIPSSQKTFISAANKRWDAANKETATPIADIEGWVDALRGNGRIGQYLIMSKKTFSVFRQLKEVQDFSASFALRATGLERAPSLAVVNEALTADGMPQIFVIDSMVTIEKSNGQRELVDPWKEGNVLLTTSLELGSTQYGPSSYESHKPAQMMQVKRDHILIQKWSEPSPLVEKTAGIANAIPVFSGATNSMIINTKAASFAG
jgi:hypothetical protein